MRILLALLLLVSASARASIAVDNTGAQQNGTTASLTYSYTVGTGTDRMLITGIWTKAGTTTPTTVTYGGVAMTLATSKTWFFSGGRLYLYVLHAPATGANNMVITFGTMPGTWFAVSGSYTGVFQSDTPDAVATPTGNAAATTTTLTLTTVTNNAWTISFAGLGTGNTITPVSPVTARGGGGFFGIYDSNGPITPAGSTSQVLNFSSSQQYGAVMIALAPSVTGTPPRSRFAGIM